MEALARLVGYLLRLAGWQVVGELPSHKKYIVIIAPHTSNWDFFVALALGLHWKAMRKTIWFGKHTIFVGVIGRFLRSLGGIPIDRSHPHRVVTQTIEAINKREELILALAPEGTRKWTDHWKSGFYLIALKTHLPVALAFIDYKNKKVGVGPVLHFTGQHEADWDAIRNFYRKEWARFPADFSEIRSKRN
ncbi:MAG: 1-acyl-sn-glycerol-3-phosphate acyltransferase [Pseudobdellovibrionaceae bacterium]|nr:1-acyl-sn-glycerol-3-phosphate acyltransferase [Pseudobdellovibrionaceae bacterium]